jgi:micrococcal nuclease
MSAPQRNWFVRHKILSTIFAVLALLYVIGSLAPDEDEAPAAAEAETTPVTPTATVTVTATPQVASPEAESRQEPTPTEGASTTAQSEPQDSTEPVSRPSAKRYAVLEVIDGDTIRVAYKGEESVRVIGIDTPETVHPSVPDECWGAAASSAAEKMLAGKRVRLVFDPTQGRRDTYDRLLAYIEAPGVGDFGLAMIRRGHAAEYTYDSAYRRQSQYQRAERAAVASEKAMWGQCGGPDVALAEPTPAPAPAPAPQDDVQPGSCAPGYDPCVPAYPPDVDCANVDGPITVTGSDPHGLDGEGDGIACES